jgi:hypothetical protein
MNSEPNDTRGMRWALVGLVVGWMFAGFGCNAADVSDGPGKGVDGSTAEKDTGVFSDSDGSDEGEGDANGAETDSGTQSDTGATSDGESDTYAVPNQCSQPYRELVNASGPGPRVRPVPWRMLSGGSPSYRKKTVVAEWMGLRELESSIQFDCPPTAAQTGLECETKRGLVFKHSTRNSGRTLIFALGIPVDRIDFPEPGTDVRLTYFGGDQFSAFELRLDREADPVVSLRAAESEAGSNDDHGSPEQFVNEYETFDVRMQSPIDQPGSAHCLVADHCRRLLRIEPLTVDAAHPQRVFPGESPRFEVTDQSYRFWHLVSFRRNQMLGPESSCADVTYPAASYAFARLK